MGRCIRELTGCRERSCRRGFARRSNVPSLIFACDAEERIRRNTRPSAVPFQAARDLTDIKRARLSNDIAICEHSAPKPVVIRLLAVVSASESPNSTEPRRLPKRLSVHPRQSQAFSARGKCADAPDVMPHPLNCVLMAENESYTLGPKTLTELRTPSAPECRVSKTDRSVDFSALKETPSTVGLEVCGGSSRAHRRV